MPAERSEFAKLKNYVFGSAAAIITNISLIVGLGSAGTGKGPILGGLLTIALAVIVVSHYVGYLIGRHFQ